jgi:hypothetical protein
VATTGAKFPSAATTASVAPWSDNNWTTPTNIYADDGNTANITASTYDTGDQSFILRATGFDFSAIPDGSTIDGVIAVINTWYRSGQGSGSGDKLILWNGTAETGNNKWATPQALSTTNTTTYTLGGATDVWGATLTAAIVKGSGFGVNIGMLSTAANTDLDVDYITLEIYYTAPVDVSISATSQSMTLTDHNATVAFDRTIAATSQSMTLTAYAATVTTASNTEIAATSQAMTLTAQNASVAFDVSVAANSQSMTLAANPATLTFDVSVSAAFQAMALVPYVASVTFGATGIPARKRAIIIG